MNKMLKKTIALLCAAVCGASMLAGCGGEKKSSDGVELTLWLKPSQDATETDFKNAEKTMEMLEAKFPEIKFNFELVKGGTDYRQEYDKALMAGTAPAIFSQFSYTDIPARIKNGTVADITNMVENWEMKKEGKIIDVFDDAISDGGKWYALPYKAYTMGTLYNVKTLKEAGEDIEKLPETWEEFAAMGVRVTDLSIPRFGYSLIGMDWCAWPFTTWVWSAGGEMVTKNDDGTFTLRFNEEPGVDAALFLNEMIWKYKMTQKDILLAYSDLAMNSMNGTSCAAFLGLGNMIKEEMDKHDIKISDFVDTPLPVKDESIPRPSLAGGEVITFNPKLSPEELEAAFKVAEYLYFSDEMMQKECDELAESGKVNVHMPARVDWYEKKLEANVDLTDEQVEALIKARENAKLEPYCDHWSDIKTQLVAPLQKIYLTEGITREEVKKLLDECADKLYELYPKSFRK